MLHELKSNLDFSQSRLRSTDAALTVFIKLVQLTLKLFAEANNCRDTCHNLAPFELRVSNEQVRVHEFDPDQEVNQLVHMLKVQTSKQADPKHADRLTNFTRVLVSISCDLIVFLENV